MRLLVVLVFAMGFTSSGQAQGKLAQRNAELHAGATRFNPVSLLETVATTAQTRALWDKAVSNALVLSFNAENAATLLRSATATIAIELPHDVGTQVLELERVDVHADGFQVRAASTGDAVPHSQGLHYRGVVRGVPGSIAAISVFGDMVMGLVADQNGQWVLGPFEDAPSGYHVLYRDDLLLSRSGTSCTTPIEPPSGQAAEEDFSDDRTIRCVRFYWEVAHDVFLNKGNMTNTVNYVTGLFNQSALLFQNDGIDVTLSEVFVWDVPSPYNASTSGGRLDQFGEVRTSFNGDLAHLLDLGGSGGVAWLNTLCNSQARYRMAYSGINSNYSNVPTYSWSVEVVTHEAGHNLGSQHTHACVWNGNNTAIDGCGPEAGYTEGSCAQGPLPTSNVGGTIMSYCHLTSSTIKFANGFGPQPTARIVNRVNSAACLPACGSSCDAPGTLFVTGLTTNSATLNWSNTAAPAYDLRWKLQSAGTWTTVPGIVGTSHVLNGLAQGTVYEFNVRSDCGGASSAYSSTQTFTTLVPCPDTLEPNNSVANAAVVNVPVVINALIASGSDLDYYRFTLPEGATLDLALYGLPDDYDLRLLNAGGTQLAISQNGGTSSEFISYAAAAGTYHAYVYGWNGAFNALQCYTLSINTVPNTCQTPTGLQANEVIWDEALLTWSSVLGASAYDLEWRELGAPDWMSINNIPATQYLLEGLSYSTEYEARVRTLCSGIGGAQGMSTSPFSTPITFVTTTAPCEVYAPTRTTVRVLLTGPYDEQTGLMHDSLRVQGLLPTTEPYSALGYSVVGVLSVDPSRFGVSGPEAIVDWVLIELRDPLDPTILVESRVGLLQRNGRVINTGTGFETLTFCAPPGQYHLVVRHRNHLGCMTSMPYGMGGLPPPIYFNEPGFATYGSEARNHIGSARLLWPGNVYDDDRVKYTGSQNDRDLILDAIGGVVPTTTISGYHLADVNLDGVVKYTGALNDRDMILQTIGGVVPTNVRLEQVP